MLRILTEPFGRFLQDFVPTIGPFRLPVLTLELSRNPINLLNLEFSLDNLMPSSETLTDRQKHLTDRIRHLIYFSHKLEMATVPMADGLSTDT